MVRRAAASLSRMGLGLRIDAWALILFLQLVLVESFLPSLSPVPRAGLASLRGCAQSSPEKEGGPELPKLPENALSLSRRDLLNTAAFAGGLLLPQVVGAESDDIRDQVTKGFTSRDFLARLQFGKSYIPVLNCTDPSDACFKENLRKWYDYPQSLTEGFTKTPTGLYMKDLPPKADMKDIVSKAPLPSSDDGTNTLQVFSVGYIVDGASPEELAEYTNPKSKKGRNYDLRNRDPRMFQMQSIVLSLGKSKLIPGFEEALATMRVGMRRTVIVPPKLGYGSAGKNGEAFRQPIPPDATLVFNIEVEKILR